MSKHTPGPWIAPEGQVNLVCTERDWNSAQIGALKIGFQAIISLQQGEAQAAIDARLIAAAPELLSWAEAYLVLLEGLTVSPANKEEQFFAHTTLQLMINQLKQTIAKAKGDK